ncbi:exopolysaccharide Pel transporter PelG [Psychrobacillus antarcticus]|uniref:exopolysaccharide Pel transporter PelG n=1 Tax=Psychrobacillus antarcticus TaxID=2879115 RepID=UPI0024089051|nr:exopolysaccharide Pel transporter PelG [Psychrobacillus antarcticus]
MAGIGFELRKLYKEEGIVGNIKAYAYSSMTTIGPMILCILLVIVQQQLMTANASSFSDKQLFISTMTYSFIFSIMFTCGISIVLTRHVADMLYQKKYEQIISSFYGALIIVLPIAGIATAVFLYGVDESLGYKISAYLFFIELIIIWIQNVYMSALKDYKRIVRGFTIGVLTSLLVSFLVFKFTSLPPTTSSLVGMDVGFLVIVAMGMYHFEQVFPRNNNKDYFAFFSTFRKYPIIFFSGFFLYSSVYVHNFMYWLFSEQRLLVSGRFLLAPFYDLPVFYAYLSVVPSLVLFVIVVETDFYERFVHYYKNVLNGGTYKSMNNAKTKMQSVLLHRIGFLVEVQLLFTVMGIALGIIYLPKIGFSMDQLDLYILLCLGYFFFIITFVMIHALMYFDDRKGVLMISALYFMLNGVLTIVTIQMGIDGLGMFIASFLALICTIVRLLYVLSHIDYYTFLSQPLTMKIVKKKKILSLFGIVLSSLLLMVGCSAEQTAESSTETQAAVVEDTTSNDKLVEDKRIYERDEDSAIKTLYLTILPKKSEKKQDVDWYALNRITDRYSDESLDIIMSEGIENGEGSMEGMFGHGISEANAKISLRGNTARYAAQKSYKIKLFDSAGLWQDQRTINLNKHISDLSRVRNKLSFDLMENIPNTTSLRTQFVHVYVKDMTKENNGTYEDYGLYTQIEQPNEMFLKNHWLDPNGYLYKVNFFEFQRYPELIKSHTDPTYDKKQFETILEVKGREEHDKLIAMLDDVNNKAIPIEDVMEKHFDLDNLMTWAAMNILMDNMDTDANNFYLYSPLNSERWFILPWDYDGGWELQRNDNSIRTYQAGISNFWGNELFNRYFRSEKNVQNLIEKVEELSEIINSETIDQQLANYEEVVKPFLLREPDKDYLPDVNTNFENELQIIRDTPKRAKQRFYDDLQKPKPFFMNDVIVELEKIQLSWAISYDLQMNNLLYNVSVAKDPLFTDIVAEKKGLRENYFTLGKLPPGKYFWKVTVSDNEGNEQSSFEIYIDEEGNNFYGIREFEVE